MHGLIFETSVWLLAESTRFLWFFWQTQQNSLLKKFFHCISSRNHRDTLGSTEQSLHTLQNPQGTEFPCRLLADKNIHQLADSYRTKYLKGFFAATIYQRPHPVCHQQLRLSMQKISPGLWRRNTLLSTITNTASKHREINCEIQFFSYRNN